MIGGGSASVIALSVDSNDDVIIGGRAGGTVVSLFGIDNVQYVSQTSTNQFAIVGKYSQ